MSKSENKQLGVLSRQVNYLGRLVLENRVVNALEAGVARYPVYRVLHYAAPIPPDSSRRRIGLAVRVTVPSVKIDHAQ